MRAILTTVCLAGLAGFSLAHHPAGETAVLAGTRPCVDGRSVQVNLVGVGDELVPLSAAVEARLGSLLENGSGLYGLELLRMERCGGGTAHLQVTVSGRVLDPSVYIGYPANSVSSDVSIRLVRPSLRDAAMEDGEVLYLVHGASLHSLRDADVAFETHITNLARQGLTAFARQWWVANPPRAVREALIIRVAPASALLFTLIASILTLRFCRRRNRFDGTKARGR